jgi:lipopolysaccharide biosynthesis protein
MNARAIALYLPQYHPIPENDAWWGEGFTEWTNVKKARPLFRDHYQPHVPAELGYYDLRSPEARAAQATLAREHGVEAFCYYHYWFAGRRLLEQPLQDVLASGEPDFPFCVCWANQSWRGTWYGAPRRMLIKQHYPGADDHRRHFETLLAAFLDPRYVRVDGRPLFLIFRPEELPDARRTLDLWRELAVRAGLPGLYVVCQHHDPAFDARRLGFDASMLVGMVPRDWRRPGRILLERVWGRFRRNPAVFAYEACAHTSVFSAVDGVRSYPCVVPNWDNTPRCGSAGLVLHGSTPELFRIAVRAAVERVRHETENERLIFIKSWNEWAEGNHLEPDQKWGRAYLEVLRDELVRHTSVIGATSAALPDGGRS